MQFYVFNSELEAEEAVTEGCPIAGKNLEGKEIKEVGETERLADVVKHPTLNKWLVRAADMPNKGYTTANYAQNTIYPPNPSAIIEGIQEN